MTVPSTVRRALGPLNSTLLPFLYQTRTILGHAPRRPAALRQSQVRRLNVATELASQRLPSSSRNPHSHQASVGDEQDIPFEGEQPLAFHQQRKSTITTNERRTFEKLFKQYASTKESKGDGLDRISEDLEDSVEDTLDAILDSAVAKHKATSNEAVLREAVLREDTLPNSRMPPQSRRRLMEQQAVIDEDEDTPLRKVQKEQFERVEKMMREAKSDVELWRVLEDEVLSVIRRLDLDGTQMPNSHVPHTTASTESGAEAENESFSEFEIIGPNYPSFLLIAMRQLRVDFPGSTLGLALLPAIKSLGRGSFALGASTELYNELIAMTWLIYSDFQGIDDLLQEMENGGVDFDANTLDLLDSIKKNALDAREGRLGNGASLVLEMDRFRRGLWKLQRWRDAIRARMEAEAIRQAKENNMLV